jgi:hypothetical protein
VNVPVERVHAARLSFCFLSLFLSLRFELIEFFFLMSSGSGFVSLPDSLIRYGKDFVSGLLGLLDMEKDFDLTDANQCQKE